MTRQCVTVKSRLNCRNCQMDSSSSWWIVYIIKWNRFMLSDRLLSCTPTLFVWATKARIDNRKKYLLSSNISSICPHNMVNFGPLTAEILSLVWGIQATFTGFRVLAALLHGTLVVGVSQTLRHWTEGATYVWQGDHQVGHWWQRSSQATRAVMQVAAPEFTPVFSQ